MTKNLLCILFLLVSAACDPYRKDKCEWQLVPDSENQSLANEGSIALCARNETLGRQKCFLQMFRSQYEKIQGLKFRYSSLEFEKGMPKRITNFDICQ